MMNHLRILIACLALGANSPSYANFAMSPSGATTAFAIDAANQGTALCAAASTECPATVPINTAGAPLFTSGAPGLVSLTGTNNIATVTAVTAITNALPAGANVIGHVIADTGSTTAVTQATGTNLHAVLDATSTTAVTQATGTNLHSVVDSGTITTVTNLAQMNGAALLMGNGVTGTGSQRVTIASDNTAFSVNVANANANGQATMANSSPVVLASNQSNVPVNTAQVNGVTVLTGTGATGTGAQRVTVSTDQATNAGAALVKGGVGVVNGGSFYQHVAASQTGAVLQTSTGAIGDYLSHCVIYPSTTAAGSVTVFDNANAAATNVIEFVTGTLSNLAPIAIPVGAVSTAGAWKVTTGANETVVCYGKFS